MTNPVNISSADSSAPTGLLCDLLAHPEQGFIATRRPTFSWIPPGEHNAPAQSAYQIKVASSLALLIGDQPDLWDSQRVVSNDSLHIPYGGATLHHASTYYWCVRIWQHSEHPGAWSQPQQFTLAPGTSQEQVSAYHLQTTSLSPRFTRREVDGSWFIDFGRAAFGWLEVHIRTPHAGDIVKVRMGEKLQGGRIDRTPPGSVRYQESQFTQCDGISIYRPDIAPGPLNMRDCAIKLPSEFGMVMPFRYVEIEGLAFAPEVSFIRVQYPFTEDAASFRSSSPDLDRIWELCRYSMLATSFAGYYVDGDRERIPYEADVYINQLSHYAVDREYSLARRSHEYLLTNSTWPTEWKQHSILVAWADYEATGDPRSLARSYDILREEKLLLSHTRADGLLDSSSLQDIVDWPLCERDDFDFRPVSSVVNAFHHRTLILMSRIAGVLGRDVDARVFHLRAARVATAFQRTFWDQETGLYVDGEGSRHTSFHANLFALAFDLIPQKHVSRVLSWIKTRGMACSVYPAQFLLEGLFKAGEATYAIDLMQSRGLRSWQNMLDHDATITWEAWDQSLKPNQDWNHAWGAAPANIIARYVLGVHPLEPGYGRILINPQLGNLTAIEGTVPTIRGPISIHATRDSEYELPQVTVTAPSGVIVEMADSHNPATTRYTNQTPLLREVPDLQTI